MRIKWRKRVGLRAVICGLVGLFDYYWVLDDVSFV